MNTDWKRLLATSRVFGVRERSRLDGSGHRVELWLGGPAPACVGISSSAPLRATVVSVGEMLRGSADSAWEESDFIRGEPEDKTEIDRLFHKLWTASGTTYYDKGEWQRIAGALRRAGYLDRDVPWEEGTGDHGL